MYSETPTLAVLRRLTNPVVVVLALIATMVVWGERMDGYYLVLAILAFFLSAPVSYTHLTLPTIYSV